MRTLLQFTGGMNGRYAAGGLVCALMLAMIAPRRMSPCCGPGSAGDGTSAAQSCCINCEPVESEHRVNSREDCCDGATHSEDEHGGENVPSGCTACVAPCCMKVFPPTLSASPAAADAPPPLVARVVHADRPDSQIPDGIFRPPRA